MTAVSIQSMATVKKVNSVANDVKTKSQSGDFTNVLNKNINSNSSKDQTNNVKGAKADNTIKTQSFTNSNQPTANSKTQDVNNVNSSENCTSSDKADTASTKIDTLESLQTDKTSDIKTIGEDNEITLAMQNVMSALMQIQQLLMDSLSMTKDELNDILSSMGMNMTDLLDQNNLTQFYLQANGQSDLSALLMDDTLSSGLTDLMNQVSQIDVFGDISEDQKTELISKVNDYMSALAAKQGNEDDVTVKQEDIKQTSEMHSETDTKDIDFTVEVTKESSNTSKKHSSNEEHSSDNKQAKQNVEGVPNQSHFTHPVTVEQTKSNFFSHLEEAVSSRDVINQIIDQVKVTVDVEKTNIEMVLKPEHLGRLHMAISEQGGTMTARIVTETVAAKEAIENEIYLLKENLDKQGLKVDAVEVAVGSYNFDTQTNTNSGYEQNEGSKKKSSKVNLDRGLSVDDTSTVDEQTVTITEETGKGSQIDLSA